MKSRFIVLFSIVLLFPFGIQAQKKIKKIDIYKVWVKKTDNSKIKGYLYAVNEEQIKVASLRSLTTSDLVNVKAVDIDRIKLRRKGKVGRSALIAGGIGAVIGAIQGLRLEGDEVWVAGTGILFGTMGMGIGAIVGVFPKTIQIHGNMELYNQQLSGLQSRAIELNEDAH